MPLLAVCQRLLHRLILVLSVTMNELQCIDLLHASAISNCLCGIGTQTSKHLLQSCPSFGVLRIQTWSTALGLWTWWRAVGMRDCGRDEELWGWGTVGVMKSCGDEGLWTWWRAVGTSSGPSEGVRSCAADQPDLTLAWLENTEGEKEDIEATCVFEIFCVDFLWHICAFVVSNCFRYLMMHTSLPSAVLSLTTLRGYLVSSLLLFFSQF